MWIFILTSDDLGSYKYPMITFAQIFGVLLATPGFANKQHGYWWLAWE